MKKLLECRFDVYTNMFRVIPNTHNHPYWVVSMSADGLYSTIFTYCMDIKELHTNWSHIYNLQIKLVKKYDFMNHIRYKWHKIDESYV